MENEYLRETELLDYSSPSIQSLISQKGWRGLSEYDAIGDAYHFVRDEILLVATDVTLSKPLRF